MRIFSSADVQPPVNLIQLPLTIELPCETYSRVTLWKLLLSPFRAAYFEISRSGDSKIELTHRCTWVKMSKRGTDFLLRKNPTVRAN